MREIDVASPLIEAAECGLSPQASLSVLTIYRRTNDSAANSKILPESEFTPQSSLLLPNTPPLVGVTFCHQMVPLELGPTGDWASVTATNAPQLTASQL
ncbi:MAG: hypothetical protein KF830_12675 [Planctomycetes bacterium]|nr:hypothetical protein [Planctomycetota bacterium]